MRITLLVTAALAGLVACGDGDGDQPPDPSLVAEVNAALCDIADETGQTTIVISGEVYDMCSTVP